MAETDTPKEEQPYIPKNAIEEHAVDIPAESPISGSQGDNFFAPQSITSPPEPPLNYFDVPSEKKGWMDSIRDLFKPSEVKAALPPAPPIPPSPTAPSSPFPGDKDALRAEKAQFGRGNRYQDYIDNKIANVFGVDIPRQNKKQGTFFEPRTPGLDTVNRAMNETGTENLVDNPFNKKVDLAKEPYVKETLRDVYKKAALAVNRNPIAALGFNPERTVLDIEENNITTAGLAVSAGRDKAPEGMYVNRSMKGEMAPVITHESIHNGVKKLVNLKDSQGNYVNKDLRDEFIKMGPDFNEYLTRVIMDTTMGGREREMDWNIRQINQAHDFFKNNPKAQELKVKMEEAALKQLSTRKRRTSE